MITDEEAKVLSEECYGLMDMLQEYCESKSCPHCQFKGKYNEYLKEYRCNIGNLVGIVGYND